MYRNPSRPSSSYGETVSVVGRKRTQVAESPATFRPIVGSFEGVGVDGGSLVSRLVSSSPPLRVRDDVGQSRRWRRRASHGTRRKTRDNPPVSLPSLTYQPRISCLPLAGHRIHPPLPSFLPGIFTGTDLNGAERKSSLPGYFYQLFPNQLFLFLFLLFRFFERSEAANIEISSQKGSGTISRELERYKDVRSRESITRT